MSEESDPLMGSAAVSNNADFNEQRHLSDQEEEQAEEYEAGGGKMSYHGVVYQLRLLMFFILRGLENKYSFSLATDMKAAEKFDDVVLRTKKRSSLGGYYYRLLQAKHRAGEKMTTKITAAALLSDSAKGDFSLRAYLESYLKLKSKFTSNMDEIMDLIICTNVKFKENDSFGNCKLNHAFEERETLDEIFQVKLLRFSNEGKRILKESLKKPLKGITHNEDDIESFLDKLSFAMDQYGNDDLEKQNKLLLQKQCSISNTEIVFPLFEKKISDWMMSFKGSYFSEQAARKFIQSLKDKFGELSFEFQDPVWNFIGREREIEEMELAWKNKLKKIVVISGLGGMGKSELARKYIQKQAGVLKRIAWMTADTRGSLMNSFHGLAKRLGIDEKEKQMKTIIDEVYAYFEGQESVFVFDNVEKLNIETEHNHYIKDFLPFKSELFIIMTSRMQWNWEDAYNLLLTEMEEDNTVNFIKSNLPPECHSSNESIKTLATELQIYPLAMQQAVAYIKRNYNDSVSFGELYSIDNYLKTFKEEASKILSCNLLSSSRHLYERTTMSTWNMTFNSIKETEFGDTAVKILKLISHFSPNNIDIKNIFIYFYESRREKVKVSLTLLKEFSVIDLNCKKIRIHRLIQKVIRLKLKEAKEDEEILRWALEFACKIEVEHKISLWEKLDEYKKMQIEYSHLPGHIMESMKNSLRFEHAYLFGRKCVSVLKEICKPTDANLLTAMNYFAVVANFQGHPNEALNMFEDILGRVRKEECDDDSVTLRAPYHIVLNDVYPEEYLMEFILYHERYKKEKNIRGNDNPDIYSSKYGMAACHTYLGNYREALKLFNEVNDKYKEILGENHPNTLTSKCSLGFTYLNLHDPAKAFLVFEEVCESGKLIYGEYNPLLLLSKHGIANCYMSLGDKRKALTLLEDVNENQKQMHGEMHHRTLNTHYEIANCHLHFHDNTKALILFEDLYEKQKEIHGENHNNTLLTKYKIAYCHSNLGNNTKALALFEDVYEKQKEILGENFNNTLITKYRIADCYLKLGDKIKALSYLENVYEKLKEINGEYNNNTLNSKHGIANYHLHFGDKTKALMLFEDVYEKQKEVIGEENHNTLISKYGIANCHLKLGHNEEALKIFVELHEKQKNVNGENHHDTLNTKFRIANCHLKLGHNEEALKIFEELHEKQKNINGENHHDTLNTQGDNNTNILNLKYQIATCHLKLGDNRKALMLFEEVYKTGKEIHGENHLRTLNSKYEIAKCNLNLGNDATELLLLEEVFEKRREIFGENHPVVKATRKDITELKQAARRNKCLLF